MYCVFVFHCTARRSCFRYTGLDYVYQISMLQQKKKRVVLDSLTNFVSAYNTFFHQVNSSHCSMSLLLMSPQGTDLFSDLEPFLTSVQADLQTMAEKNAALEKQLEKRHTYVTQVGRSGRYAVAGTHSYR